VVQKWVNWRKRKVQAAKTIQKAARKLLDRIANNKVKKMIDHFEYFGRIR